MDSWIKAWSKNRRIQGRTLVENWFPAKLPEEGPSSWEYPQENCYCEVLRATWLSPPQNHHRICHPEETELPKHEHWCGECYGRPCLSLSSTHSVTLTRAARRLLPCQTGLRLQVFSRVSTIAPWLLGGIGSWWALLWWCQSLQRPQLSFWVCSKMHTQLRSHLIIRSGKSCVSCLDTCCAGMTETQLSAGLDGLPSQSREERRSFWF